MRILPEKISRLFGLLFMNIFASAAVHLDMNWPKAYLFMGKRSFKELKKLHVEANPNESDIEKTMEQTAKYFKAIVDQSPESVDKQDWIDANRGLGNLYFIQGKMGEMNGLFQSQAEVRRQIVKVHQFDELGIEFLPDDIASGSIGNYECLDYYVKMGVLGLRPSKRLILLVDPKAPVNNLCYLNYWRRYITIISDPLLVEMLSPLQKRFAIPLNLYVLLNEKVYKSFLALGAVREQWIQDKRPPVLTLSDEDYQRGWQCLKSLGMRQGDWLVCLHAREGGWKDNNSSVEDFRNADISTYISAIKAVTDAGGWVVRLGDPTMKPLPEMPRLIDYAHSPAKSDWMDIFLCAQCRFVIATSSGPYTVAMAFGTPVAATNFLPTCCAYYLSSNDLFIPRICRFRKKDRSLDFAELFSPLMGTAAVQPTYDRRDIEVMENTDEEIKDLVEEMLERCQGRSSYSNEDEKLQKLFKLVTSDCGRLYGPENVVVNARMGKKFLSKYAGLLPSNEKAVPGLDANQDTLPCYQKQ